MVKSCSAYNCSNRFQKGVKFHKFPKDIKLRKRWVCAMKRKNYNPSESAFLCEKHFTENDYCLNCFGHKLLKKEVVPSVFDFPAHVQKNIKNRRIIKKIVSKDKETSNIDPTATPTSSTVLSNHLVELPSVSECQNSSTYISTNIPDGEKNTIQENQSEAVTPTKKPVNRKKKRIVYYGDYMEHDLESPTERHRYWTLTQNIIESNRQKNRYLRCKINRQEKKIENLNSLLDELKSNKKLSSENSLVLNV